MQDTRRLPVPAAAPAPPQQGRVAVPPKVDVTVMLPGVGAVVVGPNDRLVVVVPATADRAEVDRLTDRLGALLPRRRFVVIAGADAYAVSDT